MARKYNAPLNQVPSMRVGSGAVGKYQTLTTHMVGGHIVYGEFRSTTALQILDIDSRMDWRDRILTVSMFVELPPLIALPDVDPTLIWPRPLNLGGSGAAFLAGDMFATAGGWNGVIGTPRGGPNLYNYCNPRQVANLNTSVFAYLYADSISGSLRVLCPTANTAGTLMVVVTEGTSKLITI